MGDHLCIDGPEAVLAVWKGGTDLGPAFNPSAYPTRVRFNSKQPNLGFYRTTRTGNYTVTTWPAADPNSRKVTLFAHGLNYRPFIEGYLRIGGRNLSIKGSIPHHVNSQVFYSYTIGVDATNVYINMLRSLAGLPGALPANPTLSYSIDLSVYGFNANGTMRKPAYFNGVDINAGASTPYIKAGYFDTTYKYPYKNASGPIAIPNGRTISTGIGWNGDVGTGETDAVGLGWRYSMLGHVVQRNATNAASFVAGAVGNNSGFNASVTRLSF